jgi:SAM-dependent methyltransferase
MRRAFPHARSFCGVDVALETIRTNRERIPWAQFEQLDIERARAVQDFDLVVCSEVVEHLHDRPAALRNLASMVKPGGHLLVTCPTGRMFATEVRFGHVSHPTVDELSSLGADVGLDTVRYEHWGWPTYTMTKRLTNLWPNWAVKQFGTGRYSVAKRLVSGGLYLMNFANLPNAASGCQLFWLYRKPAIARPDRPAPAATQPRPEAPAVERSGHA